MKEEEWKYQNNFEQAVADTFNFKTELFFRRVSPSMDSKRGDTTTYETSMV